MQLIDVTDPTQPFDAGTYATAGWARGIAVSGGVAVVADTEDGIWILRNDLFTPTAVATPALATRFVTAYPNPFNPRTTLRFTLAQAGSVRLSIHDVTGRRLAVLLDGSLPQGTHETIWTGTDRGGRPLPSGVYLALIEAAGVSHAQRLVLVR
jgi:hypothetical protein